MGAVCVKRDIITVYLNGGCLPHHDYHRLEVIPPFFFFYFPLHHITADEPGFWGGIETQLQQKQAVHADSSGLTTLKNSTQML